MRVSHNIYCSTYKSLMVECLKNNLIITYLKNMTQLQQIYLQIIVLSVMQTENCAKFKWVFRQLNDFRSNISQIQVLK